MSKANIGADGRIKNLALSRRYGHELRVEVVMCERLEACQPGHGPR